MRKVRQKDTGPERTLRVWMWRRGYRFVTNSGKLPGRPDLSNTRRRWAIFVHGCFWHGHPGCSKARLPKRNLQFWAEKVAGNAARDRRKEEELRARGFDVYVVWECTLRELQSATESEDLSFPLPPHPHRSD